MPVYVPAASSSSGVLQYAWIDPAGTEHDLTRNTSPTLFVSRGSRGLGAPPVELVLDKLPFSGGSILRYAQTRPLEIDLPLVARASTMSALLTAVANLRDWFDTGNETTRTPGYLKITRPDDSVRQIACYYAGGLEGDLSEGSPTWCPLVVSLVAPDPAWTAASATEVEYDETEIASGGVATTLAVLNPGDYDAYPIWTITGPASNIRIANATTGKSFALTAGSGLALAAGDTLVIDTRPASQRTTLPIIDGEGTSYFDRLTGGSSLWWLAPNTNSITIRAHDTSGATVFGLAYTPRYRGVLR